MVFRSHPAWILSRAALNLPCEIGVLLAYRDAEAGASSLYPSLWRRCRQRVILFQPLVHHRGIAEHRINAAVLQIKMAFW